MLSSRPWGYFKPIRNESLSSYSRLQNTTQNARLTGEWFPGHVKVQVSVQWGQYLHLTGCEPPCLGPLALGQQGSAQVPKEPRRKWWCDCHWIERFILVIKSCINFAISLLQSKQENSSISFTWKSLLVEIGLWKFFSFSPSYSSSLHYPLGWAQVLLILHQKSVVPSFPCLPPSSWQVLIPLHPISCHTLLWIPDPHSLRSPHSTMLSCQSRLCEAQWQRFCCAQWGCCCSQRPKPSPADCLKAWKERISEGKWLFRDLWCVRRFLVLLRSCPWVAPSSPSLVHSFHPVFSFPQPHLRLSKCYSGFSRGGTGSKPWASGGILYHGVTTTLWNPRTTLKVARGPHPPHTCRDASGNRHHLRILPGLLAPCAPAELGVPAFPCVVPRGSPRGLHGTPGSREGLRVGWIPLATQTPSGAPKSPEQPSSNQCVCWIELLPWFFLCHCSLPEWIQSYPAKLSFFVMQLHISSAL